MERPGFVHTVFFWLEEGATDQDRQDFRKGVAELTKCKTILNSFIGPPGGTPRDVVDNSYEYCLQLFFRNKEDHDLYQQDPDHNFFIEKYKHLWSRVQVYDHLPQ